MKRVELTVPFAVLDDLGILSDRFFRHNASVEVLQSFSLRPQVAALLVRVRRQGPFKDAGTIRREARGIARRYRLERFEVLSADATRGEYLAWIEWTLPELLRGRLGGPWRGVAPVEVTQSGPSDARVVLLASPDALPRLRRTLDALSVAYCVRAVRTAAPAWEPLGGLTARQRQLLDLAYRLGYYESPARTTLDRLGSLLGISRAAVSKHLRAAERKVIGATLGPPR
jgi:DNA-binding CsgD family transcriptional regulator